MNNPQIRFTKDDGTPYPDWTEVKLGEVLTESKEQGTNGLLAKKLSVKLWNKGVVEKKETLAGSKQTIYFKRKAGQLIYSKLDFLNCAFGIIPNELDGYESTIDLPCFDISKKINRDFLLSTITQANFYKKFGALANGTRIARRINQDFFLNLQIPLPCLEEQQKIAAYFTNLDAQITAEDAALASIEAHKRGMLQGLFPRGGTQPQTRFTRDDGTPYPDWAEVKLGEVAEISAAGDLERKIYSPVKTEKHLYPVYSNALTNKGLYGFYETYQYDESCVTISARGQIGVAFERLSKFFPVGRLLTLNNLKINSKILTEAINTQIVFYSETTGVPQLTAVGAKKYILSLPTDPEEQQKIAEFFSALDAQIEAQRQKCTEIKNYKRAMLQRMFV